MFVARPRWQTDVFLLLYHSFDFTGEAGKYYCLISDENMAVNAKFGVGYTTGLTVDADTLVTSLMRPQGTWLTEAAVILGDHVIEM